jgi:hypothetical protein
MSVKSAILNSLMWLTVLTFPLQCVIDPASENIAAVCIVLVSSLSMLAYIKWGGPAEDQPLSTLAIFGFCITTQWGALLVQTAFWTPLRLSLYNPLRTFSTLALYQAIAISMHMLYRYFSVPNPVRFGVVRGLFSWAGVYRIPSSKVLWAMGLGGLATFVPSSHDGLIGRIASGFNFFAWAPFLLPFFIREVGPTYCNERRNKIFLVGYAGLVVLMGIALNVRVVMFIGVVTISLLYMLIGMRSNEPLEHKFLVRLGVLAVVLAILSIPLSNLATSMAIARGMRGKVSPVAMLKTTISVWRRPALIAEYQRERSAVARFAAYDEHYIANPLLARFVETKFHDNALHFADALTTEASKERLRSVTLDSIWAILPTPMLKLLGIGVDKDDMNYSMGDYLAYLSRGVPLGGRKTGSMFAQGEAIMGGLFPIFYACACLFLYGLMDLVTIRRTDGTASLSALAMMTLWIFFYRGVTSDALSNIFVFIFRDFGQRLVFYVVVFAMARFVLEGRRSQHAEATIQSGWPQAT